MTWILIITMLLNGQTMKVDGYRSEADCNEAKSHIVVRSGKDTFKAECRVSA